MMSLTHATVFEQEENQNLHDSPALECSTMVKVFPVKERPGPLLPVARLVAIAGVATGAIGGNLEEGLFD